MDERLARLLDPVRERMPDARDREQAADRREHREGADREQHRQRPFSVRLMVCRSLRRLPVEDGVVEPERVRAGQKDAEKPGDEEDPAERALLGERGREDRVLRPEAGERRQPDEGERPDQERDMRSRECVLQAAHPPHVLLVREVVDDDARREEEQRLEERVRQQVEDREAVRADPGAEEHVADLGHRRVRDDAS